MWWIIFLVVSIIAFLFYKYSRKILLFFLQKLGHRLQKEMYKQAEQAMNQQHQPQHEHASRTVHDSQGNDMTITYVQEPKRRTTKEFTDGEYVNYEEID